MYTKASQIEYQINPIIPPLPEEVLFELPKYCPKPTKRNLATLYYYWNRELIKKNKELQQKKQRLEKEKDKLKEENKRLKEKIEELTLQKNKFLNMIFKPKRKKLIAVVKTELKSRTKQSYIRSLPQGIDEKREAILKHCPHCQNKLSKRVSYYQRIIEDIPKPAALKAKVIQYTINRYYCKNCKKIIRAKPLEVLPKCRLGINTLLYVIYSRYRLRLSYNLIKENLKTSFNLKVSEGELNNLLNKGKQVFKKKWQEIIETIKHSKAVNADETSWRINGENHWLWAFISDKALRYTISESRGKGVAQEVLGKDYNGIVGCDFYTVYNQFKKKQRCWVHLLRKVRELTQQNPTEQRIKINQKLNRIHQQILFFKSQPETTSDQRKKKADQIETKLLAISRIKIADQQLQRVLNLCGKYAGELVVCLSNLYVPPDNNLAERALRPAVVMRKISGGSRSKQGALTHEVNLSVIETLRKQKHSLFEAMRELVYEYITSNG